MTTTKKDTKKAITKMIAAKRPASDAPKTDSVTGELTVADVAREHNVDPKKARAALRAAGMKAKDGRWPTFARGSKMHQQVLGAIVGESPDVVLTQAPVAKDE